MATEPLAVPTAAALAAREPLHAAAGKLLDDTLLRAAGVGASVYASHLSRKRMHMHSLCARTRLVL